MPNNLNSVRGTTSKKHADLSTLLMAASTAFMVIAAYPSIAHAEAFIVDGNRALNTNNQFRKIDGHPRVSIWTYSPSDLDQQFSRQPHSNGGTMLRHQSTGKCLNAHYLTVGAEFNAFPCDREAKDPDQSWNIISLNNGDSLLQRRGTNLCIDSPTRTNGGKVHLWTCNANNPNQRWKSTGGITLSDLQRLIFGNAPSTVTSQYGAKNCQIWGGVYPDCAHPALDIASPWKNPPIYSPVSGEVIRVTPANGTVGVYNSKANATFFFHHMNTVNVQQGQSINVGAQVGSQGRKGYATGDHLHFEARPGKTYYMAAQISQTINPLDGVNRTR